MTVPIGSGADAEASAAEAARDLAMGVAPGVDRLLFADATTVVTRAGVLR